MDLSRGFPADELKEAGLLDAARAGDERAFALLLGPHRPGLAVYCSLMIREPRAADEAMREVLVTAWRERALIPASPSVRLWLYRIAVGVCFDALEVAGDEIWHRRSFDEEDGR